MDTMVDPIEALPSSGHIEIVPPVAPGAPPPRAPAPPPRRSFASIDPDASVQWFERVFPAKEEITASIEVEVSWDDDVDLDTAPTLVLKRPHH